MVVLIIFSAAALWQAYRIAGLTKWSSPGAFPMLAAATMLLSGIVILKNGLRRRADPQSHASVVAPSSTILPGRVIIISVLLLLYVLAMPTLGFLLDSGLFLFACMAFLWNRSIWIAALISILSLLVIHLIFRMVFQVILPQGSLFTLLM